MVLPSTAAKAASSNSFHRPLHALTNVLTLVLVLVLVLACLGGCASVSTRDDAGGAKGASPEQQDLSSDPLEGFNRTMYRFNDKFDRYLAKPVAKGYRFILPEFARQGVSNFFSNLHDPVIMVNDLLQAKFVNAASDLGRFLVNSTIGIAGLLDVASPMGLDKHDEDFGQTLAVWGVGEGPYLVLPILGPSTVRDSVALVPDWELYPINYWVDSGTRDKLIVVEFVNRRAQLLDAGDILEQAAGEDPYVFVREAYFQHRRNQTYDGNTPAPPPDPSLFEN